MKKQTAVQCLEMKIVDLELNYEIPNKIYELLEIAKQIEKEQIIDAYAQGFIESERMDKGAEQYYNETYKL
jgi:hypothetical protein